MKSLHLIGRVVLLLLVLCAPALAAKPVIAVLDLAPNGVPAEDGVLLSDLLRSRFVQWQNFQVVDRYATLRKASELGLPLSGCGDASCGLGLGRALGADKMVVGTVAALSREYVVICRLVDVDTGRVIQEINHSFGKRAATARKEMARLADDLLGEITVTTKVTEVSGKLCRLDSGRSQGLRRGMTLQLYRKLVIPEALNVPATVVEEYVGSVKIGKVQGDSAEAVVRSGVILPGDFARIEFSKIARIRGNRPRAGYIAIPPLL